MKRMMGILLVVLMSGTMAAAATGPKVLILGFDGMDPKMLDAFLSQKTNARK